MGAYEPLTWRPSVVDGVPRSARRSGRYWAYVPDLLAGTDLPLPPDVVDRVATATAALTAAGLAVGQADLDSFASLTLRSEAVASSVIEGVAVSAKSVALADFSGFGSQAALEVARNARIMRRATREMASAEEVTVDDLVALHAELVPHLPGLRREPVWIGGANPMVAAYVPPVHDRVPALLEDLLAYLADPPDTAAVAGAVVHAQFETIHPFRDGNGRVGRALTHTVLSRAHAVPAVIPFSRVFAARKQSYVDGLTAWRSIDDVDDRVEWIAMFADALTDAAGLAQRMAGRLAGVESQFRSAVVAARERAGGRAPRTGSTVLRLLDGAVAHPIDTAAAAAERLGVSTVAARDALEELAGAGVYRTGKIDKGKTVTYVATAVLELADELAYAEGPSAAPPAENVPAPRPVPTRAERRERPPVCGYPLPRARAWCTEAPGHGGRHRRTGRSG